MQILRVGLLGSAMVGCMSTPGIHPTLHPAAPNAGANGGVATGAFIQRGDDSTTLQIGYGEGFVRMGPNAAFEVRATPQGTFVAYDIGVGEEKNVSIRPSFGLSVVRLPSITAQTDEYTTNAFLQPGLSVVFNSGSFYGAPRLGIGRSVVLEGDDEADTIFSGGVTAGMRLPGGLSFEISAIYSRNTEDDSMGNVQDAWSIIPSVGIAVGQ